MLSFEFQQYLHEKIREHLPPTFKRVGNKYNGRCPICGDSRKSATKKRGWIYINDGCSYYCFNCGTGMSGIKFLELISGSSYAEIKKEYTRLFLKSGLRADLSASYSHPTDEPSIFEMKSIIPSEMKQPLSKKAIEYLNSRKVLSAPFLGNDLYSCYSKRNPSEEYILIPWIINGEEAYYQVNDFQKLHSIKYLFPKDKKKLIAGLDNVDISWPYIICFEGFYDSIFVKNGICVGTKAITDYQAKLIKERYPHHQIVISFDNDASGMKSTTALLKRNADFKYFKWFDASIKQKDINDYVLAKGDVNMFSSKDAVEKLIVDKLTMKMYMVQNGLWHNSIQPTSQQVKSNGQSSFWKKRKVQ